MMSLQGVTILNFLQMHFSFRHLAIVDWRSGENSEMDVHILPGSIWEILGIQNFVEQIRCRCGSHKEIQYCIPYLFLSMRSFYFKELALF